MTNLLLILALSAHAAPVLSPGASYTVKKDLKTAAASAKPLDSFDSELVMDLESVDPAHPGQALFSTHTDQLLRMKKLPKLDPKDPSAPKDGLVERSELSFERLITTSKVNVPGMPKPFETRSDVGVILGSKPLLIRSDGKGAKKIDNLGEVRAGALAKAIDPGSHLAVEKLLDESLLLKTTGGGLDGTCLGAFGGKKPGDKWKITHEENGTKLESDCTFEGWSEAGGKNVAVIQVYSPKQRNTLTQPNGVPGVVETEVKGSLYYEPNSGESILKTVTNSNAEPGAAEMERLKAKGQAVPRNATVITMTSHVYAN